MSQLELNFSGEQLRDEGIKSATINANQVIDKWSERAYATLLKILPSDINFMTEDIRAWSLNVGLPEPPSLRAWGGLILRASKNGLIEKIGHGKVSNAKAHHCFAAIWRKKL